MKHSPFYKLDVVLTYIKNKQQSTILELEEITSGVFNQINADASEVLQIINKLIKDKFVDFDEKEFGELYPNIVGAPEIIIMYYHITYEGSFFLEFEGGYVKRDATEHAKNIRLDKLENDQRVSQKNMVNLTLIIAFGTAIAALYYLYLLWQDLCWCEFVWQKHI